MLDPFLPAAATQRPQEHRAWGPAGSGHGPRGSLFSLAVPAGDISIRSNLFSPHRPAPPEVVSMSLSSTAQPPLFSSSALPSEASPEPLDSSEDLQQAGIHLFVWQLGPGVRAWWGTDQWAAQASWLRALVHIRMSDDSCWSCSWYSSLCQGHGTSAACVNVLGPPRGAQAHLHGVVAAGREPGLDGCA